MGLVIANCLKRRRFRDDDHAVQANDAARAALDEFVEGLKVVGGQEEEAVDVAA
jgi:hypothetical protein